MVNRLLLAAAFAAAIGPAASAQSVTSSGYGTFSGGAWSSSSYGYGYGGAWRGWNTRRPVYGSWGGCGYVGGFGAFGWGAYGVEQYGPYGTYGQGSGIPAVRPSYAPIPRPGPVADRLPEFTASKEIEIGRRALKAGVYKAALDHFREAVTARTEDAGSQAWFAVALALTGNGRNADQAVRGVAGKVPAGQPALGDAFRDDKEKARVAATLAKSAGDGELAAAWVLSLLGQPDRLKALALKDPDAKRLLPSP